MKLTISGMILTCLVIVLIMSIIMFNIGLIALLINASCGTDSVYRIFETISDFIDELFQGRNFFGCLLSGVIFCLFLPGMMISIPIWFIKCTVCFIWRLGDKRGG